MKNNTCSLKEFAEELKKFDSIVVTTHISPDADAIGSAGGAVLILRDFGIKCSLLIEDPVPNFMMNLLPQGLLITTSQLAGEEVFLSVDAADLGRIGKSLVPIFSEAPATFCLDHHISNPKFADFNFIDANSASAAQLVLRLAKEMGASISAAAASLLYAGLMDDTGCFRYSNTNSACLEDAAELVSYGANPSAISQDLYYSKPVDLLRFRGYIASNSLSVSQNGKFAKCVAERSDIDKFQVDEDAISGLVEIARSVQGIWLAANLREKSEGEWRVSLRSVRGNIDVSKIALDFGGGGHKAASGFSMYGNRNEVESRLDAAIASALNG